LFASVPSFWNRIYGKIQKKFSDATGPKKWLIDVAVATKLKNLRAGRGLEHALFDRLVFRKTKEILGGRTRALISGSAPVSADVLDFLKVCFMGDICNGYGMTEGCGASTAAGVGDPTSGHVGGPLRNTKIRLRDLPELGYSSTDTPARGEICFKGASISNGYFCNPEKTAEQFVDGWLLSGDVGEIDELGTITVIDRVKNLFKLANGEYVAPEKIENVFVQSEWVL
jgi:long-chain acyl-CoA synthetase